LNPLSDLETIYRDAVLRVDPAGLMKARVRKEGPTLTICGEGVTVCEDLARYRQIIVLGIGKASARMASALESILEDEISAGLVLTKYGHGQELKKIKLLEAGHPIPDKNSLEGARILAGIARAADEHTLIINLISGGGSSLFCLPAEGLSLEDKQETTRALLASGATIDEMNCIRKHLSLVKGGGLAKLASPARLINLILSDVIGDRIDTIASGITVPDPTTFEDALAIIRKYALDHKLPPGVRSHLARGAAGEIPETPKADDPVFRRSVNIIVGNNTLALNAARETAEQLGYDARIFSTTLTGEASGAGAYFAGLAQSLMPCGKASAVICGGETTVTLKGRGKGGRNQELALAFAVCLRKLCPFARNVFFLSAGTDGSDGPTDAAGALITPRLMEKMKTIAAEAEAHLARNDSYPFFEKAGGLFRTGPTYTNVCDIQILIVT